MQKQPSEKRMIHFRELVSRDAQFEGFGVSLAGMDEVGRGPLAGNVVTACVIMPSDPLFPWADDSKKLSAKRRDILFDEIMGAAIYVGIGEASPDEIDAYNILNATKLAMQRAAMQAPASLCIVDAVKGLSLPFPTMPIIHGDALSYHVACASIVAKVTRDRQMQEASLLYPDYGFERNMGYGTPEHIRGLESHGPTPIHRKSFIKKWYE